ncbi:MAG: hypothetical protein IJV02_00305 [Candidatus Methanomethylophilaceae archaeon]|nr:hypothetical protein [Candidatus Methanomethylophilaceae archaeon]
MTNAQAPTIRTLLTVTVTDATSLGYQSGRTVVVSNGDVTLTGVTDSSGTIIFKLSRIGDYTVQCDYPSGYVSLPVTVKNVQIGGLYSAALTVVPPVRFKMTFNATAFKTDDAGCLTYGGDCAGFTPVSGPGSSLAKCSSIGSWVMNADGTSSNKILAKCFYATFTNDGVLHQKLNPQDLSKYIATWDDTNKEWVAGSGNSAITTENTMFCIPTLYFNASGSEITLSDYAADGEARGHTIDGHEYQYLAIGVYEGYNNNGRLMSLSGKVSSASITRPTFRTYAQANPVQNGKAMLWNYYQHHVWWVLNLFATKRFNGQLAVGKGGLSYNGSTGQGMCNAMGPFAGCTGTSSAVKSFIENPWGYKYEFIDDFVVNNTSGSNHVVWAGQNSEPDDTYSAQNKKNIITCTLAGGSSQWATAISTDPETWGFITAAGGSSTVGLCDSYYFSNSTGQYLGVVGGYSSYVSDGYAGPSCLYAGNSLPYSYSAYGARLAFVFDL